MQNREWLPITQLMKKLDGDGICSEYWLRNADQEAIGFYCNLGMGQSPEDCDLPPTVGWFEVGGKRLGFSPTEYREVEGSSTKAALASFDESPT